MSLACWLLCQSSAQAAELRDISYSIQPDFIDVRLRFDSLPEYAASFRYAPDRYVLSFSNCTLAVAESTRKALATLDSRLLTRISTSAQAGPPPLTQLGFYLNMHIEPSIRQDGASYLLRFPVKDSHVYTQQLAPGLSLSILDNCSGESNRTVYIVRIGSGSAVQVYAAGADRYDGKTRLRGPSSFAKRESALAVLNGGFFNWNGQHLSTFVEDGFVRAAGVYPNRPMLVVTGDGQVILGRFTAQTALLVTAPGAERAMRIPLSGKNTPFISGKVIAYDHLYDRSTLPRGGMFYYMLQNEKLSYAGEDPAQPAMQPGTILVATDIIPEANPLRGIDPQARVALETRLTDAQGQVVQAQSAIGGGPQLVENAAVQISTVEDSIKADISASARARSAVALTAQGDLLLVAVKENSETQHSGMTLQSLANLLLKQGAVTAINLDGGGSTALAVNGQLLNISSEKERPVSNVLVIKPLGPTATVPQSAPPLQSEAGHVPVGQGSLAAPVNKYDRQS